MSIDVPEAARANTPEGATAFARFFIGAGIASEADWNTSTVQALSDSSCTTCAGQVKSVEESKLKDERTVTNRMGDASSQVGPGVGDGTYVVDVLAHLSATQIIDSNGKVLREVAADEIAMRVNVRWTASGFRVSEVQGIKR